MGIFSKKNFQCPFCVEKFKKRDDLANHGQTVHSKTIQNCSLCEALSFSPQSMIEHTKDKHDKVKVGWQIVFLFVPLVVLWAYYRIERFGSGMLLAVGLMGLLLGGIILMATFANVSDPNLENNLTYEITVLAIWPLFGVFIWLKIHYMIKWSREWNKKIDTQIESMSQSDSSSKDETRQD